MGYEIKLDIFEGPLDLLLYLIKKNDIDIFNIPIALITEQYLKYVDMMRSLNLTLAGEYLVLASTLLHIKSRMLLPAHDDESEEDVPDPREQLVKQLLEYQVFKGAAFQLDNLPLLNRDFFKRGSTPEKTEDIYEYSESNIFELVEVFYKIMSRANEENLMEIDTETMSVTERMNKIMEMLSQKNNLTFTEILEECVSRRLILYTFLAILELMKLKVIKVYQTSSFGVIRVSLAVEM